MSTPDQDQPVPGAAYPPPAPQPAFEPPQFGPAPNVPTWHAPPLAQPPQHQPTWPADPQPSPGWPYAATPVVEGLGHPGKRLLARIIDWLILFSSLALIVAGLLAVALPDNGDGNGEMPGWGVAVLILSIFGTVYLYEAGQLALWGATLGKRIMRLRVTRADALQERLSVAHGFGRAAVYPLLFTVIGALPLIGLVNTLNVLWQLWDRPMRQCLHDKIAGTAVVDTRVFPAP